MVNSRVKNFFAVFFIASELLAPAFAFAQISGFGAVPVTDSNNGSTPGGAIGTGLNASALAGLTGISAANTACMTAEAAYEKTDSVAQAGFSGLAIIGGDSVLLGQLAAKITAYNGFITCRQSVLASLNGFVANNVYVSSVKQQLVTDASNAVASYKTKLEQTQARYDNAKQGFWKTLVFNILIKTSKSVAQALVTKLVSNYKVRNAMQYVDSVATLVYDNQFLRQNFPNSADQFMARAILNNPQVRTRVPATMFIAADAALGFDPKSLDPSDPNFYTKMASVGNSAANPYFQHSVYTSAVDQAHASALAYAQNEVAQGAGFKTPYTCAGTYAQQQALDLQYKSAADMHDNRLGLLNELKQAKELGKPVSDADIKKAQADYDIAYQKISSLPQTVPSPAEVICEGIVSPANLIGKGVDQAFQAIGVNMAQYNNNNLPGFMNLISDVASQIGTNFIFGGTQGAKGALLVNEGRLASGIVTAAGDFAYSQASANLAQNGVVFSSDIDSNNLNSYVLSWQVLTDTVPSANFVTVSGDGLSAYATDIKTGKQNIIKLPLDGKTTVVTTKGGNYTLTVYDSGGRAITSSVIAIIPNKTTPSGINPGSVNTTCGGNYSSYNDCVSQTNDNNYCASLCGSPSTVTQLDYSPIGTVAGATAIRPQGPIRGPAILPLSLR